jgi:hypothetical protein
VKSFDEWMKEEYPEAPANEYGGPFGDADMEAAYHAGRDAVMVSLGEQLPGIIRKVILNESANSQ